MLSVFRHLFIVLFSKLRARPIFRYFDGSAWRSIDPMRAFRAIKSHPTYNAETHPVLIDMGDFDALDCMLGCAREVFGVQEFNEQTGKGLTQVETVNLMVRFNQFLGLVKKNTKLPQTLPPATASESLAESPTNNGSACTSTCSEVNSAAPSECSIPSSSP